MQALYRRERPDLVTLDITMPEKSGVAVYRKLKEDERFKQVPVIIITGVSDDFKKFISTRSQVPPPEGYISKPVDADLDVFVRVAACFQSSRQVRVIVSSAKSDR